MIRLLMTNGCSLTRGEELTRPEAEAWPVLLADRLGVRLINLARDGGSNRRVVRTSALALRRLAAERGYRPEEVLFLALWTHPDRTEYYDPEGPVPAPAPDAGVRATPHPSLTDEEDRWRPIGPWLRDRRHRPVRAFYRRLWSEQGQLSSFFLDWTALDAVLERDGFVARYAFGYPFAGTNRLPAALPSTVAFAGTIDETRVYGGLEDRTETSFLELTWDFPRGPGMHPLADSHALLADTFTVWLHSDPRLDFIDP
jgi:hypothetical protein